MILHYIPTDKIIADMVAFQFLEGRQSVRDKLAWQYQEDNQQFQIGGDDMHQRRDIYRNLNDTENFFFLGYDEDDCLAEIEVHFCDKIRVFDIEFDFNEELTSVASKLKAYSDVFKENEGEVFFRELKISIMNESKVGGSGSQLGYFYCAHDVSHLE